MDSLGIANHPPALEPDFAAASTPGCATRRRARPAALLLAWVGAALCSACGREKPQTEPAQARAAPPQMVGVSPKDFRCDSLLTEDQLGQLMGGRARAVESAVMTPVGVASPCTYLVEPAAPASGPAGAAAAQKWTFDLDCRDGMQTRAEALFEQYTRTSAEAVERAAATPASERGTRPERPERPERPDNEPQGLLAREVPVGARGLDHHGHGLLFIDDDTPCYVRVVGGKPEQRLALAQHLVRALVPATAPMSRRLAPQNPAAGGIPGRQRP